MASPLRGDEQLGSRRLRRGLALLAGGLGFGILAWAGSGIAGGAGAAAAGNDALVAGAAVCYGLVLLGAGWIGRGGRDLLVLGTLLGLGTALLVAGPLGLGLVGPVNWGVVVATVSLVVGLPAVLLLVVETSAPGGARAAGV